MGGIFGLIENTIIIPDKTSKEQVGKIYKNVMTSATQLLQHRGLDSYGNKLVIGNDKTVLMVQTGKCVGGVGDSNGDNSVYTSLDNSMFLIIDGEIFNWRELQKELQCVYTGSEVIFGLYQTYKDDIPKMLQKLQGQFSFMLYDLHSRYILIARDPIGVTPLYFGKKSSYKTSNAEEQIINRFAFASELKCLTMVDTSSGTESFVDNIRIFYPRSYLYSSTDDLDENYLNYMKTYMSFYDLDVEKSFQYSRNLRIAQSKIRELLYDSVHKQLKDLVINDIDFGVLLSGDPESSIIASIVVSIAQDLGHKKPIRTFSIHQDNNPSINDITKKLDKIVEFLNTEHKAYTFTTQQAIDNVENVILFAETYDSKNITESIPRYLLTQHIRQEFPNISVLFTSDLSNDLFGYHYCSKAPFESDFQSETVNLISNAHAFTCLQVNKMCMANSFQVRMPFADIDYVRFVLQTHPQLKIFGYDSIRPYSQDKELLREAFDQFVPKENLKATTDYFHLFSSLLDDHCENLYTDIDFETKSTIYTYNKPQTKEQLLYREIFYKFFNNNTCKNTSELTVKIWQPKW